MTGRASVATFQACVWRLLVWCQKYNASDAGIVSLRRLEQWWLAGRVGRGMRMAVADLVPNNAMRVMLALYC
jgi:hypothetical protein